MLIFRWFLVQVLTEKASLRAVLKKTVSLKSSPEGERLMKTLHSTFLKGHGEEEEALYLYSLFLFYISCQKFYILIDLTFMPNSSFSPFPVTLSPSLLFPFHSTGPCPSSSSSSLAITSVSYALWTSSVAVVIPRSQTSKLYRWSPSHFTFPFYWVFDKCFV